MAYEVTTLWRYTNLFIITVIIIIKWNAKNYDISCLQKKIYFFRLCRNSDELLL